jgi:hypothetical protein
MAQKAGGGGAKGGSPPQAPAGATLSPFKRAKMASEFKKSVFGSVMPTVLTTVVPHITVERGNEMVAKAARKAYLEAYPEKIRGIKGSGSSGDDGGRDT